MMKLGWVLALGGEYTGGEALSLSALDGFRRTEGPEHFDVIATINILGRIDLEIGRAKEAEARFRSALELARRTLGPAHVSIASYQTSLGVTLMERGDVHAAEPLFRDSLAICRKSGVPTRQTATVLAGYGRLLLARGELQAAEPMLMESLTLRQGQYGKSHPITAESLLNLAALRIAQKRGARPNPCRAKLLA